MASSSSKSLFGMLKLISSKSIMFSGKTLFTCLLEIWPTMQKEKSLASKLRIMWLFKKSDPKAKNCRLQNIQSKFENQWSTLLEGSKTSNWEARVSIIFLNWLRRTLHFFCLGLCVDICNTLYDFLYLWFWSKGSQPPSPMEWSQWDGR